MSNNHKKTKRVKLNFANIQCKFNKFNEFNKITKKLQNTTNYNSTTAKATVSQQNTI